MDQLLRRFAAPPPEGPPCNKRRALHLLVQDAKEGKQGWQKFAPIACARKASTSESLLSDMWLKENESALRLPVKRPPG